jgi:hypothetical protein
MAATPTRTETITSNIPDEVKKNYVNLVGEVDAFAKQPYQYYQGQRFADINPLEQQYYQGATNLGPSEQLVGATNMANQAGIGALNSGMFGQADADQYMSPYIQNVLNVQKQAAMRDYNRQIPGMQAAGARFGGLGGTRGALAQSEGMRNLQNSLQGIDATGMQNAWQQAQAQYNADQARRMTGIGLANQSASMMNQIGDTDFNQRMNALNTQRQAGADLYGRAQAQKDFDYQQFTEEQNLPYRQYGLRSDIYHGIPTSGQTTNVYGQSSQAAGVVGSGVSAYNMFKPGG